MGGAAASRLVKALADRAGQVSVFLGIVWFAVIVVGFWVTTVLVTVEDWSRADVLLLGVAMGH